MYIKFIMNKNELYVTKEELTIIKNRLDHLVNVERKEVIEELKQARKQGDLSENADYDAAKKRQSEIEFQINDLSNKISYSIVVKKDSLHKKIGIGSEIKFLNLLTKEIDVVFIGGSFEGNLFVVPKIISYESPFAQSIIKHRDEIKKNFIVTIVTKNKKYDIKILDIKY